MADDHATLVTHLDETATVTVVTTRKDGTLVATPIWAVVVDGTPYVRAAYGERTAWFRRAVTGRPAFFTLADGAVAERDPEAALADPRVPVTVTRVPATDEVQDAVTAAFEEKYLPLAPEHVPPVVSADAVARTVALRPA